MAGPLRAERSELTVTGSAASLTVFAREAELATVLGRIGAASGANVIVHGSYGNLRVSDSFEGVQLRAALVRILGQHSYVLIHRRGVHDSRPLSRFCGLWLRIPTNV
jgi:hypothetical protein